MFLIVSYHFAQLSGHSPSGSSDTAAKIFYATLQEHVIKGSGDFMGENSPLYTSALPKIDSHKRCVKGYIIILVCHVILQDHGIICHVTLWVEGTQGHYPVKFCGQRHFGSDVFSLSQDLTKPCDYTVTCGYR